STIRKATSELTDMVTEWNNLSKTTKAIASWTAVVGGVGVGAIGGLGLLGSSAPKVAAGLKLIVPLVSKSGPLLVGFAALASVLWAGHRIWKTAKEPVDDLRTSMNTFRKTNASTEKTIRIMRESLFRLYTEGVDTTNLRIQDLDVSANTLSMTLNETGSSVKVMIDPMASVNSLLALLEKRAGDTKTKMANLGKSTEDTETKMEDLEEAVSELSEESITTSTSMSTLDKVLRVIFNPMDALARAINGVTFEMSALDAAQLGFLGGAKLIKPTSDEVIAGLTAEANAFRAQGIELRNATDLFKLTDKEKADLAQADRDRAFERGQIAEADQLLREQEISGLHIELRALEMAGEAEGNALEAKRMVLAEQIQIEEDYESLLMRRVEVEETTWRQTLNATAIGMNSLVDAWVFLSGNQNSFHETWLSQTADFVTGIANLLNDLTNAWTSAVTIINKIASFLPGGEAGGAANIAGLASAVGGGTGVVGGIGSAIGSIGGALGTVGSAIGSGASAAIGGVGAGVAAVGGIAGVGAIGGGALVAIKIGGMISDLLKGEQFGNPELRAEEKRREAVNAQWHADRKIIATAEAKANTAAIHSRLSLEAAQRAATKEIAQLGEYLRSTATPTRTAIGRDRTLTSSGGLGGTGRIESLLSQILSALTSGASGGSRFNGFDTIGEASRRFDTELGTLATSMLDTTRKAFALSDELAGHSLTSSLALTAAESIKAADALRILRHSAASLQEVGEATARLGLSITAIQLQKSTSLEASLQLISASRVALGELTRSGDITKERNSAELALLRSMQIEAEAKFKDIAQQVSRQEIANEIANHQLDAARINNEVIAERQRVDSLHQDIQIGQSNELAGLLQAILDALQSNPATNISRQDIGLALWEIIAPSARAGGFV
ncbi:hypothetical protein LCGC14_0853270, partial [marine sediment metagenome]